MHQEIGHAVAVENRLAEWLGVGEGAGVMVAGFVGFGLESLGEEAVFQAERVEHADGVGGLLDAGADAGKAPRLLIDAYVDADAAKAGGGGQSADAGADDGDMRGSWCHAFTPMETGCRVFRRAARAGDLFVRRGG